MEKSLSTEFKYKPETNFDLHKRAQTCIAQGYLTNSKRPQSLIKGIYPTHLKKGLGCHVQDYQGKYYIDFITGLGTNLLGFANATVTSAVIQALMDGNLLSLGSEQEIKTAEKLKEAFTWVNQWKFLKTGAEACSAAIKIARAYHGVSYGNEDLPQMWEREIIERISTGQISDIRLQGTMQSMHQNLHASTTCDGKQTPFSKKICENEKGNGGREKFYEEKISEGSGSGISQVKVSDLGGAEKWSSQKETLRKMWRHECSRSSRGLQQTTGSDVALPLSSRSRTPKWLILSDGYHAHHDNFSSLNSPSIGVPMDCGMLPLSGNEDLIPIAAAVIIEPIITDISNERIKWLRNLREVCTKNGTLLIHDEIVTGFRFPGFSASKYFGIEPDLIVIGKAMANGHALAAVGGKYDVMECDEYFVSSTYAGCMDALVACEKVVEQIQKHYKLEELWDAGMDFINQFNFIWPEAVRIEGYPTRGVFVGNEEVKAKLFQEACYAGILLGPSWFFNFPLMNETYGVMGTLRDILSRIKNGHVSFRGEMPKAPMAQKVRGFD